MNSADISAEHNTTTPLSGTSATLLKSDKVGASEYVYSMGCSVDWATKEGWNPDVIMDELEKRVGINGTFNDTMALGSRVCIGNATNGTNLNGGIKWNIQPGIPLDARVSCSCVTGELPGCDCEIVVGCGCNIVSTAETEITSEIIWISCGQLYLSSGGSRSCDTMVTIDCSN